MEGAKKPAITNVICNNGGNQKKVDRYRTSVGHTDLEWVVPMFKEAVRNLNFECQHHVKLQRRGSTRIGWVQMNIKNEGRKMGGLVQFARLLGGHWEQRKGRGYELSQHPYYERGKTRKGAKREAD